MLPLTVRPIDCDVHIPLPDTRALLPYFGEHWREQITSRGIDSDNHELSSYPPNAPLTCRPDWRPQEGHSGIDFEKLREHVLDPFQPQFVICNVLHGSQIMFGEDLSAAMCRAINDWLAAEWLDRDCRLRASIVVPMHSPELAVAEIQHRANDRRFVQVLMLAMAELPLGRRQHWPIYAAAERYDLPIGIHAGSSYRHSPSPLGWPSYYIEDYVAQSAGFSATLNSLLAEGVFSKFPRLKVVLMESGVTWLPAHLWRINKTWRAVRSENPWIDRLPSEIIREHVRLTIQPFDAPPMAGQVKTVVDEIGSDEMLLFSTDYPHWHFDGTDAVPDGLPEGYLSKILVENALQTYPRLR
ncbi:amidohydrolase family protein [Bradyrhizobium tunisiense]|uniref:amidohydrolase family protein n=1 Tax=Bradyrhizobium tunisiense TaxID=3278709 RepID=UPI0035DBE145